jgi:radical SAM protein with 4Fe4S-binding SPASM domain
MNCGGAEGFRLGRFYPELEIDERVLLAWKGRDALHLRPCRECQLGLLCGGGCSRLVANRGGDLATDVVCPPMVNVADLQVLLDHYLPLILEAQGKRSPS